MLAGAGGEAGGAIVVLSQHRPVRRFLAQVLRLHDADIFAVDGPLMLAILLAGVAGGMAWA